MKIHNALPDPEVVRLFEQGVQEALGGEDGAFVAWLTLDGAVVRVHLEEPARKETLGGVVQPWKRTIRIAIGASKDEVRARVAKLRDA